MSLGEIHLNLYLNVYAAVNSWWVLVAGAEVQNTAFYTMMGLDRNCSDADVKRHYFSKVLDTVALDRKSTTRALTFEDGWQRL
jgi:hypothetical protein